MRLQVKGKNLEISDSIRSYAEQKLRKLDKQLGDLVQVELELAVEKNPSIRDNQVAEATVFTKGHPLRVRAATTDMRASIDGLTDKLSREVKEYRGQAPPRAAPPRRAQRRVIFKRKPLHERLAEEGGLVDRRATRGTGRPREPCGTWLRTGPNKASIHGVHRPREWDEVETVEADVQGESARFVVLPNDDIVDRGRARRRRAAGGRADARAAVSRRGASAAAEGVWAVAARRIEVVELPGADGSELRADAARGRADAHRGRRAQVRLDPCAGAAGRTSPSVPGASTAISGRSRRRYSRRRMSSALGSFEKVLRAGEGRRLKRIAEQAEYVLSLQPEFEKLSDAELRGKTAEFRAAARERRVARGAPLRGVRRDARGASAATARSSCSRCR